MTQSLREVSQDLHQKLVDYWHDVDFNWGRNAGAYYTDDAVFGDSANTYNGREAIEAFYRFRESRGARTNVHLVSNWTCSVESGIAKAMWICLLYAHDGEPPQPSAPPIGIARVEDEYVSGRDGEWLCRRRMWHGLFHGGVSTTVMTAQDRANLEAMERSDQATR